MTPEQFKFLQTMLKERSGLVVADEKRYPLDNRLGPVAKKHKMSGVPDLVDALKRPGSEALRIEVTEAMTINESFFFRDKTPFQNYTEVMLPHLLKARADSKKIRIWSAAASTGQEAYSLAISTKEQGAKCANWNVEIFGTDLSKEVLEKAKSGLYSQFEVQRGIPSPLLVKYFKQNGNMWQIDPAIRAMAKFQIYNLLNDFRKFGTFDIIFCRNVLIYFDVKTKTDILNRLAKQLAPDGYLILGGAETIVGLTTQYQPVRERRGLYQLKTAENAAANTADAKKPAVPVTKRAVGTTPRPRVVGAR